MMQGQTDERGIVGLDLSLRGAAAVYIPPRWNFEWKNLRAIRRGYELQAGATPWDRAYRLWVIAEALLEFVRKHAAVAPYVYVEDYAYGLAGQSGMYIAEVGGAVKATFARAHMPVQPVNISSARKLFLGKLPRKGSAIVTHKLLREIKFPYESADEGDAFVVANWGLEHVGRVALSCEGHT